MSKLLLALFDSKAEEFFAPFLVPTLGMAYRNLQDEIKRGGEGNILSSHPEDFILYRLGTYDTETGDIVVAREMVCKLSSLVE
ncbi:MAG: nonstructural protein [Microvirus sp.]|nr:MAG: nonstructural protein [Microvirus sp.]